MVVGPHAPAPITPDELTLLLHARQAKMDDEYLGPGDRNADLRGYALGLNHSLNMDAIDRMLAEPLSDVVARVVMSQRERFREQLAAVDNALDEHADELAGEIEQLRVSVSKIEAASKPKQTDEAELLHTLRIAQSMLGRLSDVNTALSNTLVQMAETKQPIVLHGKTPEIS